MVRLAVFGAAGRMGRAIIRDLAEFPDVALAAAVEAPGSPALGADAGTLVLLDEMRRHGLYNLIF
ncbi:MAG: 4-hydroxy-tetrahydrodipicolinate reductase, partial [Kiritimatiellae bacterium]|nr:4-hydroxy-tetrahydrodipicolinate reductase [Kiritimatiellia bacterium]